jgi:hypothetical protein
METAHFTRLSQAEWGTAEREEFTASAPVTAPHLVACTLAVLPSGACLTCRSCLQFTMPVEVDWSKHDRSLVGRFWAAHPGEQAEAAEISDRILVYHRGVDTVSL